MTLGGEGKTTTLAPKAQKAKSHRRGPYRLTLPGPSWGPVSGITVLIPSRPFLVRVLDSNSWWRRRRRGRTERWSVHRQWFSECRGGQWGPQQQLPTWKRWQPHLGKARAVAALAVSNSNPHGIPTPAKCKIGCKLNVMGLE